MKKNFVTRYNTLENIYEIGYYCGTRFIVILTQKALA